MPRYLSYVDPESTRRSVSNRSVHTTVAPMEIGVNKSSQVLGPTPTCL